MDVYQNMISRQKEIFSEEEQEILRTTPIVIIGCGGLGGTIIEQFVRACFEELTIVDQDVFDETSILHNDYHQSVFLDCHLSLVINDYESKSFPLILAQVQYHRA